MCVEVASTRTRSCPTIMDVIALFRKAIKLLTREEKVYLQVILLILAPFSFLILLHYLVASPFMQKIEDSYESSSLDTKGIWALVAIEFPFIITTFLVFLFGISVTIFASAKKYSSNPATLKDLLMWFIPSTWKKLVIAWLYLSLLTSAYIILSIISIQLTAPIATENTTSVGIWLMVIFFATTYPYFASVWTLALVISVLEDDSYGAEAINEGHELMGRKKLLGFLLMSIPVVLSVPISVLFYLMIADDDYQIEMVTRFVFMLGATVLFCSINLFTFVVLTLFYYECKQGNNCGEDREMAFDSEYALVHEDP